ncbi:MAG: hypothetical protein IJH47_03220 [Oscillospiraceae bacterium]|nr:hypothetical protein [Oscillospiraceae bacterium]
MEQAPVLSAAGGAGKQSKAILERRFLSSPVLSLQEKGRMGKRKNVSFPSVFYPGGRGRCAGPMLFLVLGKKEHGEKEPLFARLTGG